MFLFFVRAGAFEPATVGSKSSGPLTDFSAA
jgi:hypothetical protein